MDQRLAFSALFSLLDAYRVDPGHVRKLAHSFGSLARSYARQDLGDWPPAAWISV